MLDLGFDILVFISEKHVFLLLLLLFFFFFEIFCFKKKGGDAVQNIYIYIYTFKISHVFLPDISGIDKICLYIIEFFLSDKC
jgi:hypothetical protein